MYIQDGKSPVMLLCSTYNIKTEQANRIVSNWLEKNLQKSSSDLYDLIKARKIILKEQNLWNLPDLSWEDSTILASEIQSDEDLEIKNRWYGLKCYRQCFIGSELVDFLVRKKDFVEDEAIAVGQSLLEHGLISHVCNDHEFKNEFLFYHFAK